MIDNTKEMQRAVLPLSGFSDSLQGLISRARALQSGSSKSVEGDHAYDQACYAAANLDQNEDFKILLEYLGDCTLRRLVCVVDMGDGALLHAARREGENAVVWRILQMIARGQEKFVQDRSI